MMNIGERIIELREAKHVTTTRFARLCGLAQSHLRDIEHGNKEPTVGTLKSICKAFGISLSEFFSTEEEEKQVNPLLIAKLKRMDENQQLALLQFLETI